MIVPQSEKGTTSHQATKAQTVRCKKNLGVIICAKSRTTIPMIRNTGTVIASRSRKVLSPGSTRKKPEVGNLVCSKSNVSYNEKGGENSTDYEEFIICTQLHSHSNNRSLLHRGPPQPAFQPLITLITIIFIIARMWNKLRDTTLLTIFVDLYKQNNSNGRAISLAKKWISTRWKG